MSKRADSHEKSKFSRVYSILLRQKFKSRRLISHCRQNNIICIIWRWDANIMKHCLLNLFERELEGMLSLYICPRKCSKKSYRLHEESHFSPYLSAESCFSSPWVLYSLVIAYTAFLPLCTCFSRSALAVNACETRIAESSSS